MAKQDFQPILDSGIHRLTIAEFEKLTVSAFPADLRRATLFHQFLTWTAQANNLGLNGTLWLDGSFLTAKPSPDDIDCVLFNASIARTLNTNETLQLRKLLNHDEAKVSFNLDLYLEAALPPDSLFHRQAYWSGVFGFQHDRTKAKGFVEITI